MATQATHGYGSKFSRTDDVAALQVVGEMTALTPPGMSKDTPEATHFASPDRYREFLSGLRDGGEAEVTCNLVAGDQGQTGMLADYNGDVANTYEAELADGTKINFEGIVTNVGPEVPMDDKISQSFSIKVTGKPTVTLAA